MTKSGVERDFVKSPYIVSLNYGVNEIDYIFSSPYAMEKFKNEYEINRKYIHESLTNRFRMKFYISDDFCDINLYRKIERRGFYIVVNGRAIEWLGNLEYDGQKVIAKGLGAK